MNYIEKGVALATLSARESNCPNFKVGAALMKGQRCVSRGRNFYKKSHPKSKTIWNGIHAEFNCLHGLDPDKAKGCVIFVVRIMRNGELSMARPCDDCLELLNSYGVRAFYYTDYDGLVQMERL
jgi:deoxycytidylate deaminase